MQQSRFLGNNLVHGALVLTIAVEAAGVSWQLADSLDDTPRAAVAVVAALIGGALAWAASYAPERERDTELARAVEQQDMRAIPRWWAIVPLTVALLGAAWLWLALGDR